MELGGPEVQESRVLGVRESDGLGIQGSWESKSHTMSWSPGGNKLTSLECLGVPGSSGPGVQASQNLRVSGSRSPGVKGIQDTSLAGVQGPIN